MTSKDDVLAALSRRKADADATEAQELKRLQDQIDQLAKEYGLLHANILERMRCLPADDKHWVMLTLDDGQQLPAIEFRSEYHSGPDYEVWHDYYYISYDGEICGKIGEYSETPRLLDPMEPKSGASAEWHNKRNTIKSYEQYIGWMCEFCDKFPETIWARGR